MRRVAAVLIAFAIAGAPAAPRAQAPAPMALATARTGGSGTIYVGTYAKTILAIDEATMKVRDSIKVSIGIPYSMQLSFDKRHFYAMDPLQEKIEIIDIAAKRAIGQISLSRGTTTVRMIGVNLDPKERFAVLLIKTITKQSDRYVIGRPTLVRYDLATRAVTDTIRWPNNEERENAQIIFSPNGDLMYFFTQSDVLVYDNKTLKQVDRWEIAQSFSEEGLGRINAPFTNDVYEEPGFYTGMFRITDPVNRRQLMGVARIDLANRSLDYYTLGPSQPTSFTLAPGKKRGYGLRQEVGNYQIWTFDLENRRVESKREFPGRPRMRLMVSSNGSQLYIGGAGATIERYDATTLQPLGMLQLDADMTAWIMVPRATPPG